MAVAIYTCSVYKNSSPKYNHSGDLSISGTVAWGATSTVGDSTYLCKVPHGAVIVDIVEDHTTGATTQVLKFGFDRGVAAGGAGNLSAMITAGAQATVNRRNVMSAGPNSIWGNPLTISVSDNDPKKYAVLIGTVASGTTTTSLFVSFTLSYRMDGPEGTPPKGTSF